MGIHTISAEALQAANDAMTERKGSIDENASQENFDAVSDSMNLPPAGSDAAASIKRMGLESAHNLVSTLSGEGAAIGKGGLDILDVLGLAWLDGVTAGYEAGLTAAKSEVGA